MKTKKNRTVYTKAVYKAIQYLRQRQNEYVLSILNQKQHLHNVECRKGQPIKIRRINV